MNIEIYGAEWCTFCKQAVALCEQKGVSYTYQDIDNSSVMKELTEKLGSPPRSVPQIFVNNQHMGAGYQGLSKMLG